jgi:hypothetical protein
LAGAGKAPKPPEAQSKASNGQQLNADGKWTFDDPEKQRRYQKGACFTCGEDGHMSNACPNKEKTRSKTPAVKASDPGKKKVKLASDADSSDTDSENA